MKKTLNMPPLSILNTQGYLAALCLLFSSLLTAQNTAVFKIYNQTVREGTAIGAFNNGNNYLINTCSGNQAQYLWTDGQGNLLDAQNDFVGSCGQYRYDADNYIKTDSVGTSPNRDVRLTKMRRDGSTVWAKTYPLSMDNFGQFAVPTSDGGFLVAGATQVTNDTTYKIQLIKTDANGSLLWQKTVTQGLTYSRVRRPNATNCYDILNGKMITITNVGQTSDGGFYLQYLTSEPSFDCVFGGGRGAVLIRLDANGNYLWNKTDLSGAVEGKSHRVAATENGNILLLYTRAAGDTRTCTSNEYKLIKLSTAGATLWSFEKGGSTCTLDRPQFASAFGIFPNGDVVLETQGMTIFRKISGQTGLQIDSIIQTPIDSARGVTSIATLADGTFAVTGYADGTSIWKTFFYKNKFNTPSVSTGYCASKGVAPWELWTRNVSFNTINNTSEKFKDYATLGFSDYTNLSTTVNKGQTYPLSILPPTGWNGYFPNVFCRVWIDFNKNNIFDDNEKVLEQTNANAFTTNVLIPITAATGSVRMRVSMKWGGYPTACETFEKGEVEDYTILIAGGQTLPDFTTNISEAGVTFIPEPVLNVSSNISNLSSLFTGITTFRIYASRDSLLSGDDKLLYRDSMQFAPNEKRFINYDLQSWTLGSGTFYLIAVADEANLITESNELNNRFAFRLIVDQIPACANDVTPPVFTNCRDTIFKYNGNGHNNTNVSIHDYTVLNPIATDNCGTPTVTNDVGTTLQIQGNNFRTIIFTAKDAKGNTATCQQKVTVQDTCVSRWDFYNPQDTTIYVDANATCGNFQWTLLIQYNSCFICQKGPCYATLISVVPYVQTLSGTSPSGCFPIGTTTITHGIAGSNILKSFKVTVIRRTTTEGDIALTLTSTPSVFTKYAPLNFTISAKSTGNQSFTNVKIEFKFPTGTTNGGAATPSVGTWQEWCAGSIQCFTWAIPTLAANANATLNVPVYVLNPTSPMVATAKLLSSTPVDNVVANNIATISLNAAPPPARLIQAQPTQLIPIVVDQISPSPSDGEVTVELESLDEREVVFDFSDAFGKMVKMESRKVEKGTNRVLFEVFDLPQGIYFVSPSTNKGKNVPTKFVKM